MVRTTLRILQSVIFYCILLFGVLYAIPALPSASPRGEPVGRRYTLYAECFAQQDEALEFSLDVNSATIALPQIFRPAVDLSGRGFSSRSDWPQELASSEALNTWQKDIGFNGIYRLQYNLWEISRLAKDQAQQDSLLLNYENIIGQVSQAGGIVILDIFSTPAGLGKVLDKKSAPLDLKRFKEVIKSHIRRLSCQKRYNIWYEVWSAPDIDGFFLGRKQEYFNIYRVVAEAIGELEEEYKIYIPIGGPSTTWWFQNLGGNTIITPERSLIYELINFCYRNRLPLNFITWHGYSTDPKIEKEMTVYKKSAVSLIRDWLTYFNLDRNMPLIVDEWNYDRDANVSPERDEKSNVCASYVLSRIRNMYDEGINYQLYFSLEDFQNNKEGVNRNTGLLWFDSSVSAEYKGGIKSTYNVFRMLSRLDNKMFASVLKFEDEFVGILASKSEDEVVLLVYNYIDPDAFRNYLSRNISSLQPRQIKFLLKLLKSDQLTKVTSHQLDIVSLRTDKKVKALLNKALAAHDRAIKLTNANRNIKIGLKNLSFLGKSGQKESTDGVSAGSSERYLYQRYAIDSTCSKNCEFIPVEEKEISSNEAYSESLSLSPYSVQMVIFKNKPPVPESIPQQQTAVETLPAANATQGAVSTNTTNTTTN